MFSDRIVQTWRPPREDGDATGRAAERVNAILSLPLLHGGSESLI